MASGDIHLRGPTVVEVIPAPLYSSLLLHSQLFSSDSSLPEYHGGYDEGDNDQKEKSASDSDGQPNDATRDQVEER